MRRAMTLQISQEVITAVESRAENQCRSVADYVESVLRRELALPADDFEVFVAPELEGALDDWEVVDDDKSGPEADLRRDLVARLLEKARQ